MRLCWYVARLHLHLHILHKDQHEGVNTSQMMIPHNPLFIAIFLCCVHSTEYLACPQSQAVKRRRLDFETNCQRQNCSKNAGFLCLLHCLFGLSASSTEKTTSRLVSEVGGAWIDRDVTVGLSKNMSSGLSGFVCLSSCCAFPSLALSLPFTFPSLPFRAARKLRKSLCSIAALHDKQRDLKISEDSTALSLSKERTLSDPVSLLSCQRQLPLTRNSAPAWQVWLPQHCRCGAWWYNRNVCCLLLVFIVYWRMEKYRCKRTAYYLLMDLGTHSAHFSTKYRAANHARTAWARVTLLGWGATKFGDPRPAISRRREAHRSTRSACMKIIEINWMYICISCISW